MNFGKLMMGALAVATAGLFAFNGIKGGTLKGSVSPAEGAVNAWALSSTDTLKAVVSGGMYEIPNVKPGVYKVIIEAKPPYKNASKDNVSVSDNQSTQVEEIKLQQ